MAEGLATPTKQMQNASCAVPIVELSYRNLLRDLYALNSAQLSGRKLLPSPDPTYVKTYPVRPHLPVRVFIPQNYKSSGEKLHPLHIGNPFIDVHAMTATDSPVEDIHGGGFALFDPRIDDEDNAILSGRHGICVISISYSQAPDHPWPTAVHDVAAVIDAILEDQTLPVDRTRVSVGGYSAGGNLALTATQLDDLPQRVAAVVAIYPNCDFETPLAMKLSHSELAPGKDKDFLQDLLPAFQWAYIPHNADLRNPLLSPINAPRERLPRKLFIIGCQYDVLCKEALRTAEKLAAAESQVSGEEKAALSDGWTRGSVRWMRILAVEHAFNQTKEGLPYDERKLVDERHEYLHRQIADWLYSEVYKSQ